MIIIVNNAIKEFCIYGDPMIEFDDVMLLLKRKFGESNITWYRATTESLAEDLVTEEKRGNKRAVLAEWLQKSTAKFISRAEPEWIVCSTKG